MSSIVVVDEWKQKSARTSAGTSKNQLRVSNILHIGPHLLLIFIALEAARAPCWMMSVLSGLRGKPGSGSALVIALVQDAHTKHSEVIMINDW